MQINISPEPWTLAYSLETSRYSVYSHTPGISDDIPVAHVFTEPDARAIAALPELVQALEFIRANPRCDARFVARAALAKAGLA